MPRPDILQSNLESQFEKVDKMYDNDEVRVFEGPDTKRIFEEIDLIRRKQIELAAEHIALESIDDMSLQSADESTDDKNKRNLNNFQRKQIALKSLMSKLDELSQIMNRFREAPELNPHRNVSKKVTNNESFVITAAPTSAPTNSTNGRRKNSVHRPTTATTATLLADMSTAADNSSSSAK